MVYLVLTIEACRALADVASFGGNDPFVVARFGTASHRTPTADDSRNPDFGGFEMEFDLGDDAAAASLDGIPVIVSVVHEGVASNTTIGIIQMKVAELRGGVASQWFNVMKPGGEEIAGQLRLSSAVHPLAPSYKRLLDDPVPHAWLTAHMARELRDRSTVVKQRPFVAIQTYGSTLKTHADQVSATEPRWGDVCLRFPVPHYESTASGNSVYISVKAAGSLATYTLGYATLPFADVVTGFGERWVDLTPRADGSGEACGAILLSAHINDAEKRAAEEARAAAEREAAAAAEAAARVAAEEAAAKLRADMEAAERAAAEEAKAAAEREVQRMREELEKLRAEAAARAEREAAAAAAAATAAAAAAAAEAAAAEAAAAEAAAAEAAAAEAAAAAAKSDSDSDSESDGDGDDGVHVCADPSTRPWLRDFLGGAPVPLKKYQSLQRVSVVHEGGVEGATAEAQSWMGETYPHHFAGEWRGAGGTEGWRYNLLICLRPVHSSASVGSAGAGGAGAGGGGTWPPVPRGFDQHVEGFIRWTLVQHPASRPNYAQRVGTHAFELVAGMTKHKSGVEPQRFVVHGYRCVDPGHTPSTVGMIAVAEYRMKVAQDGRRLTGGSRGYDGTWGEKFVLQPTAQDVSRAGLGGGDADDDDAFAIVEGKEGDGSGDLRGADGKGLPLVRVRADPDHAPWLSAFLQGEDLTDAVHQRVAAAPWTPITSARAGGAIMARWTSAHFTRRFTGTWTGQGSDAGWVYNVNMRYRPVVGERARAWPPLPKGYHRHIEGCIVWTLVSAPASQPAYAGRVGSSALEVFAGMISRRRGGNERQLRIHGYGVVDPAHDSSGVSLVGVCDAKLVIGGRGGRRVVSGVDRGYTSEWASRFELKPVRAGKLQRQRVRSQRRRRRRGRK